ncbi:hypothetical protein Leryth_025398 [Lithospermum erythrorhizon]|nr:hypothetical protein Leryth_025398 [Lithospermum erythrorhizon]
MHRGFPLSTKVPSLRGLAVYGCAECFSLSFMKLTIIAFLKAGLRLPAAATFTATIESSYIPRFNLSIGRPTYQTSISRASSLVVILAVQDNEGPRRLVDIIRSQ